MTTMDSDSESQDSDDGRRFRFEATRKDNVRPEAKRENQSTSTSKYKSSYNNDDECNDRKDKCKHNNRRERRSSKERDTDMRNAKYSTKYSKHAHDSRSSKREDSLDTRSSPLSSKRKITDSKRHRYRDRSEHRKHRSQERSRDRSDNDRVLSDKHKNKLHEKYKHSRDRSRDRGHQSRKVRSLDSNKFRGEYEKHTLYKKSSVREDEQGRSDGELLKKRELSVESHEGKELDLSEFDVLSEIDENLSDDDSDVKNKDGSLSHCKAKTKARYANDNNECSTKKHDSSNNNPGAISESELSAPSPTLEIEKPDREITDVDSNLTEETCLRRSNCDSPKAIESDKEDAAYGPTLPSRLPVDTSNNTKLVKDIAFIGPCIPEQYMQNITENTCGDDDDDDATCNSENHIIEEDASEDSTMLFGPALPPHLLKPKSTNESEARVIGPTFPTITNESCNDETKSIESDNDELMMGPLPANHPALENNIVYKQLEQRAQQLKNEQSNEDNSIQSEREEWMVELPAIQIANLGLAPRKFRTKEGPDMSDRSCWTDTPAKIQEKQKKKQEEKCCDYKISDVQVSKESYESSESRKREKSLLEIHQNKLRKKKKKEEKKAQLTGQTVRRPFDRDIDLQINRFDQAQKTTIINKAQYLDERFSRGKI